MDNQKLKQHLKKYKGVLIGFIKFGISTARKSAYQSYDHIVSPILDISLGYFIDHSLQGKIREIILKWSSCAEENFHEFEISPANENWLEKSMSRFLYSIPEDVTQEIAYKTSTTDEIYHKIDTGICKFIAKSHLKDKSLTIFCDKHHMLYIEKIFFEKP